MTKSKSVATTKSKGLTTPEPLSSKSSRSTVDTNLVETTFVKDAIREKQLTNFEAVRAGICRHCDAKTLKDERPTMRHLAAISAG